MAPVVEPIESILAAAVEIAAEADRRAYLERACGGDAELRRRVEELIANHFRAGSFLESPPPDLGGERPGTLVGPYKLLEQIGEGGFGVVFLAEQTRPVRRKVALKVLKPGMDSREVVARFEAERQALALMDHPNIAKVLDGGTTEAHGRPSVGVGRPYFVMELVRGIPITDFCDRNHLTPRQRLELFVPVCQAVQHAHQKGVIHRDLKPSNVLVTVHDTTPVPKVIDFGIAKALGQELTDKTLYTGFAQMVGTPLYMSPEQAGFSGLDADTRSDIYSLGVLLYELLTGATPFDKERFQSAGYDEVRRIIREEEPAKPSTRLSTLGPAAVTASANRGSEPHKLSALIKGELDWIVMKCLEKDRARRYESAGALAADVERYLSDEPVLAGRPSAAYRLRKFARRHRGPVLAAGLVLVALLLGLGGTTWGLVRAERAREAEADERKRADDERAWADDERQIAEAVQQFLQVGLLRQADPFAQAEAVRLAGGQFEARDNPTVRELLDRAAAELAPDRIEARFPNRPRVQAEVLTTIGRTYLGIGEYDKALALLARASDLMNRALGPTHTSTLAARGHLAVAHRRAGRSVEAVAQLEALHSDAAAALGPQHSIALTAQEHLAGAYMETNRPVKAIAILESVRDARVAAHGPTDVRTFIAIDNLAAAYRTARRAADAVTLLEGSRDALATELPPDHPTQLSMLDNLAGAYMEVRRTTEAIELYETVRAGCERALTKDHPQTLATMNNLAAAYWRARKLDRSVPLFEETLRRSEDRLGKNHPDTLMTLANLGVNYRDAGRKEDGIARMEEALARARERRGPIPMQVVWVPGMLAATYDRDGQFAKAEPHYRWMAEQAGRGKRPELPKVAYLKNQLGQNLLRQGKGPEAEEVLLESQAIGERDGADAWWRYESRVLLGAAKLLQKEYAEAGPLLETGYEGLKARRAQISSNGPARLRDALGWLIQLADAQKDTQAAEKWRSERKALAP
jgi:non-specific serine/threonine protein kinase/serine/threonine-protein kinase